jgi:hypothetical protein
LNTAIVTGAIDHTEAVAMALKREGFEALAWEAPGAAEGLPPGSVGCYVQLAPDTASSPVAEVQSVGGSLAQRIDTVARLSALLAPDAAVVLVASELGWDPAALHALRALAAAVVAKRVGSGARVSVVDSGDAGAIAAAARRERNQARAVSLADLAPEMTYADWRDEVLNLTSGVESTYFGWLRSDGVRRAAVLRGSVLSPLPDADDCAQGLARAVLMDALGATDTEAGGLREWAVSLADDFLHEVIRALPEDGFELPIHEVAAWVVRRSLSDDPTAGR